MNINYLTPRFFPSISGGEFYIQKIAEYMQKRYNENVGVLCSNAIDFQGLKTEDGLLLQSNHPNFKIYNHIPIQRVKLEYIYLKSEVNFKNAVNQISLLCEKNNLDINSDTISLFLTNGFNINYLIEKIEKKEIVYNYDIIHSTFLPYSTILYSLLISKINLIPSVCTPFYHIFNPRYEHREFIKVLSNFNTLIACTQYEKEFLIKNGISCNCIEVTPMGVDFELYNTPVKSKSGKIKSFKKENGIKNPFILYCGHKNYEKGALSLLKASELVHKNNPNIEFVFIGPTTTAFDVELKKIRKLGIKIHNLTPGNMTGYYDWRKISAFQECSIFAMPSRSDTYGMVYLEAWAAGKPVIGAKNPVMQEVIHENKDGCLVEFDNIPEIAESILNLINNPNLRDEMGKYGQKKVKKNNTWDLISEKTHKIYRRLIE